MRVVLDTNILISAALKPAGNEARVVMFGCLGRFQLCVSTELEAEYRDVTQRKKFIKQAKALAALLSGMMSRAEHIAAAAHPAICGDPDDDMVLGCALSARADYLITGNLADYPTGLSSPKIVNARQFLDSWDTKASTDENSRG